MKKYQDDQENNISELKEEEVKVKVGADDINKNKGEETTEQKRKNRDENKKITEKLSTYFGTASSYTKKAISFIFLIASMLLTGTLIIELYSNNFPTLWVDKPAKLIVLAISTALPIYLINIFLLTTLNAFKKTLFSKEDMSDLKISLTRNIFSGTLFSFTLILVLLNYDFFSYKVLFNDRVLTIVDFIRHIIILEITVFIGIFYEKIRKKQFFYGLTIILTTLIYFTIRYVIYS